MRNGLTLPAAFAGVALLATCVVVGAGSALATPETIAQGEPMALRTSSAAPAATATEACGRKVRVVYSGYAAAPAACIAAR